MHILISLCRPPTHYSYLYFILKQNFDLTPGNCYLANNLYAFLPPRKLVVLLLVTLPTELGFNVL